MIEGQDSEKKDIDFEGEESLDTSIEVNRITNDVYPDAPVNIARETASVFQLKRKCEKGLLVLSPEFQREFVWSTKQQCELIESILMGIPLPAFYVREDDKGVYIVVDGRQRLTTLFKFLDGKLKLSNLTILRNCNDCSFKDLSPVEQNKIEDYSLNVNVIKSPTPDRVTFDLFDRVNRSGTKLNNQEMRNALYQGLSTRLIKELSENDSFRSATEHSLPAKHMKDRYFVLRFIAFYMLQERLIIDDNNAVFEYKSNIEDLLGNTMKFLNVLSENDTLISEIKTLFSRSMDRAVELLLPLGGFRLPNKEGMQKRPLNMAFFDSISYLLSKTLEVPDSEIVEFYKALLNDDGYVSALTYSVDSKSQVEKRYERINQFIIDKCI